MGTDVATTPSSTEAGATLMVAGVMRTAAAVKKDGCQATQDSTDTLISSEPTATTLVTAPTPRTAPTTQTLQAPLVLPPASLMEPEATSTTPAGKHRAACQ